MSLSFFFSSRFLLAQVKLGTPAGTRLTNICFSVAGSKSGGEVIKYTNLAFTNVAKNAGAEFIRADADKSNGQPSLESYFTNSIKNWGNATDTFVLQVTATNTNSSGGSDSISWKYWFTDLYNNKITNLKIPSGKTNMFIFIIKPSSNAKPGSWVEYKLVAKSSNSTIVPGINTTIYTGDNNYIYGGPPDSGLGKGSMGPYYITICSQTTEQDNEFVRLKIMPGAIISITKSVSNILLNGAPSSPIPGASILYKIKYTNESSIAGSNVIIYDKIPGWTEFFTNSSSPPADWKTEYSTNENPDQSWNSTDYQTNQPPSSLIKWIRWKKPAIGAGERDYIYFKVIIK